MDGAVIRTRRVKTPSLISAVTHTIFVLLFSFAPPLRAPWCVSVLAAVLEVPADLLLFFWRTVGF